MSCLTPQHGFATQDRGTIFFDRWTGERAYGGAASHPFDMDMVDSRAIPPYTLESSFGYTLYIEEYTKPIGVYAVPEEK